MSMNTESVGPKPSVISNFELENRLASISSALSALRCQLAGRPESYERKQLLDVDDRIAHAQLSLQSACLLLGCAPWVPEDLADPDVDPGMSPLVAIVQRSQECQQN